MTPVNADPVVEVLEKPGVIFCQERCGQTLSDAQGATWAQAQPRPGEAASNTVRRLKIGAATIGILDIEIVYGSVASCLYSEAAIPLKQ